MPISADQWRVVVGANNVRRPRQCGVRCCNLWEILGPPQELKVYQVLISLSGNLKETTVLVSMVIMLLLLLAGDVETNPGPGTDTPEYLTMVQCTAQLTTLFKHDLSSISDHLWAQGMMSEDIRGELSEPSHTRSFKATCVVDYLTERIKDIPGDYHKFVKIVKKLGPWAKDMAEHLDQTFAKNRKAVKNQTSHAVTAAGAHKPPEHPVICNPVILTVKENLEPIKKAIWDARVKWRDIGGGLKVPYDTLEEIRYNRDLRHDGERLEVVLCHWIRTDKATINDLLKVLSGKVVHRNDLANRVTALQEEEERIGVGLMAPKVLNQPVSKDPTYKEKEVLPIQAENAKTPVQVTDAEGSSSGLISSAFGFKAQKGTTSTSDSDQQNELVTACTGGSNLQSKLETIDSKDVWMFCVPPVSEPYERQSSADSVDTDGAHGQAAPEKLWPCGKHLLFVYFMNSELLNGIGLQTATIMAWANKWETPTNRSIVPRFKETNDRDKADIRVKFESRRSWSKVGTDAGQVEDKSKPTMVLSLIKGQDEFNCHTVIHEFGHALGLEHEHQRSIFWKIAAKLFDLVEMKKDCHSFNVDIVKDYLESEQGGCWGSEEYDPDSIMHYWFDKKWLKSKSHRSRRKVSLLPDSDEKKKVLLGIHTRHRSLADIPSVTDYKFLEQCYCAKRPFSESSIAATNGHRSDYATGGPKNHSLETDSASTPNDPAPVSTSEAKTDVDLVVAPLKDKHEGFIDDTERDVGGPSRSTPPPTEETQSQKPRVTKIGLIGATNSGKSTTLNALLRGRFLPTSSGSTTAQVLCIKHNPSIPDGELHDLTQDRESKLLASGIKNIYSKLDELNKSRRAAGNTTGNVSSSKLELQVRIPFLCQQQEVNLEFYDTPGTSEDDESQIYKDARQVQDNMERLILVLSQDTALHKETADLLSRLRIRFPKLMSQESLFVLMNKYDLFFDDEHQSLEDQMCLISKTVQIDNDHIVYYSAKLGLKARTWQESADEDDYDDFRVQIQKMPGIKKVVRELHKKKLPFIENVKELSRIAEDSSCICSVENLILPLV